MMILQYLINVINGNISVIDLLSDRELEVFEMTGFGKSTKEMSEELNLSIKTIETYKSHIKVKLNIKGSTELI